MQMEGVSRREVLQSAAVGAALFTAAPAFAQRAPGSGYPVKKKEIRMKNANYAPVVNDGLVIELLKSCDDGVPDVCSLCYTSDHHLRSPWLH